MIKDWFLQRHAGRKEYKMKVQNIKDIEKFFKVVD